METKKWKIKIGDMIVFQSEDILLGKVKAFEFEDFITVMVDDSKWYIKPENVIDVLKSYKKPNWKKIDWKLEI